MPKMEERDGIWKKSVCIHGAAVAGCWRWCCFQSCLSLDFNSLHMFSSARCVYGHRNFAIADRNWKRGAKWHAVCRRACVPLLMLHTYPHSFLSIEVICIKPFYYHCRLLPLLHAAEGEKMDSKRVLWWLGTSRKLGGFFFFFWCLKRQNWNLLDCRIARLWRSRHLIAARPFSMYTLQCVIHFHFITLHFFISSEKDVSNDSMQSEMTQDI